MLKKQKRLDDLIKENLKIIQNDEVFSFSTDAPLLAHFTRVRGNDSILDLCAGNGVITLLLAAKSHRKIESIEIQEQLTDMAQRSFKYNQLEERLSIHNMDLKDVYQTFKPSQFTLITYNPPYFKRNQLRQHQKEAHKIARHEIMCSLEDCMLAARHLLKQDERLVMVHRAERPMDVLAEMRQVNIEPKCIVFIYSKHGKSTVTIVAEERKNGNQGLEVAPPFYIYNENGEYSEQMKEAYYG